MFSNRTSQNSNLWMDITRKRSWPLSSLLALLFLGISLQFASAQCDITSPPQPVSLTVQLDGSGSAGLSADVMNSQGINSSTCPYPFGSVYNFYDDMGAFLGSSTFLSGPVVLFDCAAVGGGAIQIFVAIDDDFTPGGNESSQVELSITVEDNMDPVVVCPTPPAGTPYSTNFDGMDNYDCRTSLLVGMPITTTESETNATSFPIPDLGGISSSVTIGGIPAEGVITDIRVVDVGIDHTWVGDLVIELEAPDGEALTILERPGRAAAGLGDSSDSQASDPYDFDDSGATSAEAMGAGILDGEVVCLDNGICEYSPAPEAGTGPPFSFAELASIIAANGSATTGTWTLNVSDDGAGNTGSLESWTLEIDWVPGLSHASVADNCPGSTLDVNYANPDDPSGASIDVTGVSPGAPNDYQFYAGTTTITYTATDASGNTHTCSMMVEIEDDEVPSWVDPTTTLPTNYANQVTDVITDANGRMSVHVELECQTATFASDFDYWTSMFETMEPATGFWPTAEDNCDTDVEVNYRSGTDNDFTCVSVSSHDNVDRRVTRFWEAVDDDGNILTNPPNALFALNLYVVDNIAPSFDPATAGVSTPTALAAPAPTPGPGPLAYAGMDLTVNTTDAFNPDPSLCEVDMTAMGAPDMSVTPVDCVESDLTNTWTINTTSGTPPATTMGMGTDASQVFPIGTHEITYTSVDDCGQTSTFVFNLVVVENTPPAITGCPMDIAQGTDVGVCEATVQWTNPEATDCSGGITFVASGLHAGTGSTILIDLNAGPDGMGGILAEGDFPTGTTTVTYTFTDGSGNEATCVFDVVITDDEAPTIAGCADVTINSICPDATVPDYTGAFTISDNCPGASATQSPAAGTLLSALTLSNDTAPAGLSDGDQFTITITPTDAAGNTGTACTITATLMDLDEPIPSGPLVDIDASNTIGADCGSLTIDAPTATDCNGLVIFGVPSVADGTGPGPNQYIYLTGFNFVTWTYNDGSGNVATQSQTITVSDDTTDPTVNAGADRPRDTDPGVCTKTMSINMTEVFPTVAPYLDAADAPGNTEYIDNCGVASITYTLTGATTGGPTAVSATPVTFELGVTTVTYIATDAAGNTGSDQMIVTVSDNEDPVLDMACWSATLLIGTTPGDATADDCAFSLGAADTSYDPTPTDNCASPPTQTITGVTSAGGSTFVAGPSASSLAGASFPVSTVTGVETYTIGWSFDDGNGNVVSCFQTITVEDRQAPSITCVDEEAAMGNQVVRGVSEDGSANDCSYTVQGTEFDPTTSDNCGVVSISNNWNHSSTLAGEVFNNNAGMDASYTVVWTVTDAYGNSNTCTVEITIEDDVPPLLSCLPGSIFTLPPSNSLTIDPIGLINPFFTSDDCTGDYTTLSYSMSQTVFTCADATDTPISVTITATDIAGNSASCNTTVTIQENVAPDALCQDITIQLDAAGDAKIVATDIDGGSTDNCTADMDLTFSASPTDFDCSDLAGPASVTLTVTDLSGNSSTCTALVTVEDNIDPTAVCQSVNAYLDASGVVTVDAKDFDGGSTDNDTCNPLTFLINGTAQRSYDCSHVGSQAITLTVTDGSGNSSTCTTTVVVIDNTPPTPVCQDLTVNLEANGMVTIPASDFNASSSDNCDPTGSTLTYTINGSPSLTVDCDEMGLNTITVTVTDLNGNTATCTPNLTVLPNDVVTLNVGSAAGAAGGTVGIPITIENFAKVRSLQFTLLVDDPTVAAINSITLPGDFSSASTSIVLNSATFSWFDPANAGLDLVDGALVMTLNLDLIGMEGDMSTISLSSTPTPIEVTQGCGPIPFQTTFDTNNGDVTIDPNTTVSLSGIILTEQGEPVDGVLVTLSGDESDTDFTDVNGMYDFTVPAGSNVTITPTTNMVPKQGVTSLDLAIIQSHIVSGGVINSPYKLIAGNPISLPAFSLNITSADLALIQQVIVIFGADFTPNSDSWKFVESSYMFANPTAPWLDAFTQETTLMNANTDLTDINFVGIKMGDVNDTWPNFSLNGGGGDRVLEEMSFVVDNQKLLAGQEYTLDFKTKDFVDIMAFQASLNFDKEALAFMDSKTGSLPNFTDDKVGLTYLDEGKISLIWYNHEGITGRDDEAVFSLRFKALTDIDDLSEVLALSNSVVEVVAYQSNYTPLDINLEFEAGLTTGLNGLDTEAFALYQNQPNPFTNHTVIGFNLPETTETILSIMDVSGKVLKVYQNSFGAGYNEISIDRSELPTTGVLYYQLDTPKHTATGKMVIIE